MKFLLPLSVLLLPVVSSAAVVASGDFSGGTTTPTLSFTTPIEIPILRPGEISSFVFDEWTTDDGVPSAALASGGILSFRINGGLIQTIPVVFAFDNFSAYSGSVSPNDGVLVLSGTIPVTAGQTLTILDQTFSFIASGPGFNAPSTPFTGVTFPVDSALSSLSIVPEPSTSMALALGSLVMLRRRR
jgi:hypothetical protein